jgi:hypothetical protein
MKEKLDEYEIAKLLLAFSWDSGKVGKYAKDNDLSPPSDSDLFWAGFIAAAAERHGHQVSD